MAYIFILLVIGMFLADFEPRTVVITHPAEDISGRRGVMVVTTPTYRPLFQRQSTAMLNDDSWEQFCPLAHFDVTTSTGKPSTGSSTITVAEFYKRGRKTDAEMRASSPSLTTKQPE